MLWTRKAEALPEATRLLQRATSSSETVGIPEPPPVPVRESGYFTGMSKECVEIVRDAFAEFERGNFWIPEIFDPSVRVVWLPAAGVEQETVGLDAMSRTMKEWLQPWEQATQIAEKFIDAGDQVVVIAEWRGRGKASGVFTRLRYGSVWTLRDGKVISLISYPDPADALEAAGLSQRSAHADSP